jgi:dihydropyrimidinase
VSILLRAGTVVTADSEMIADVLIDGSVIAAIATDLRADADEVIDLSGKLILPGGVDVHTHMETPSDEIYSCDDFRSGTEAAVFGGTTTIVDFATQLPGVGLMQTLDEWKAKIAQRQPWTDVGLHMIVTDIELDPELGDFERLCQAGVTSYKLFMAYKGSFMVDDQVLFRVARAAAENRALLLVHAENGDVIDVLEREAVARGHRTPEWHARTRPKLLEAEAASRAIYLAQQARAPLYIVHVSCDEVVDEIVAARKRGWKVWGETCPQYLYVDEGWLAQPDFEGAKYVFTPPPRTAAEREALWQALADGSLSVLSTDHCPYMFHGQKSLGRNDFTQIPQGAPGIETRLTYLYDRGVRAGRIGVRRFVDLVATTPARLFGLYPKKGVLAVGSDADVVAWDPNQTTVISARTHHSAVDYSLFEGMAVTGGPSLVMVGGQIVVRGDALVGEPRGRFLARERFTEPTG